MPKREYNKIKSMTPDEVASFYQLQKGDEIDGDDYWYKGVYEYGKELYEFGKYTDFDPPKKSLKPFFKNKDMMSRYTDDYDFYVVTAEFLEYVIGTYRTRIQDYYSKMLKPFSDDKKTWRTKSEWLKSKKTEYGSSFEDKHTFDFTLITEEEQTALFQMIDHIRSMGNEWNSSFLPDSPYKLKNETPEITNSWKYEYGIFELVRIYKSFDWKRNVMIYYGY